MECKAQIFRYNPEQDQSGSLVEYNVRAEPGMSVLSLLHQLHDEQDGTLAYRYSCPGAPFVEPAPSRSMAFPNWHARPR
ncbi:MAG: 2Fe-2S iron-sulfur cluster-binding protein [bacterium]|nr:2Fe-2S iron-sulfur cluster-binding protein [bacterium]